MQLMEQPQKLLDLLHRGCVAQSNGGSLTGVFGPKVHNNVHRLLKRNMIAFMGSDAHNLRHRNTDLKGAREKLEQHWGAEAATELLETRPLHILQNKALPPELYADRLPRTFADEDGEKPKKKGFFAKLFG
jgi:protein-tyrosine phosphatase